MTTLQLYFFNCIGLVITTVVAILTRASFRRVLGALAGTAVAGILGICLIPLGEKLTLWHFAMRWEPSYLLLFWVSSIVCAYVFLIVWRIVRRFGGRGLLVVLVAAAIIGPPRDYWYMKRFPEWGYYGPGIAPVLGIATGYVMLLAVGYGVMRLVAGPDHLDRLAPGCRYLQRWN